jgi:hypothetical protein
MRAELALSICSVKTGGALLMPSEGQLLSDSALFALRFVLALITLSTIFLVIRRATLVSSAHTQGGHFDNNDRFSLQPKRFPRSSGPSEHSILSIPLQSGYVPICRSEFWRGQQKLDNQSQKAKEKTEQKTFYFRSPLVTRNQ